MNSYQVVGAAGVPHAKPMYPGRSLGWRVKAMYPFGPRGPVAAFGAVVWRSSRTIPSQLRQRIQRGVTSSAGRRASRRAASPRSYQSYYRRRGRTPPAGMRQRIERANIEVARRKAATAARRRAEAERRARVAVHPRRPAANAGIREWEAYYRATGTRLTAGQRRKIEYGEKAAFARATGAVFFVTSDFMRTAGVGRRRGVMWMFSAAYSGRTMPYWDLWYDRKRTAKQIAAMVAADYVKEITRRVQLRQKRRLEREAAPRSRVYRRYRRYGG